MDDLLKPLEIEHDKLVAEEAELDDLSDALATQRHKIDDLEQAAKELLDQVREAGSD